MGPIAQGVLTGVQSATGAVKNLGDGNFTQTDDQATATNAAPESAGIGVNAVQALPVSNQKANIGIEQAAKKESELGAPVGNAVKNTGLDANQESLDLVHATKKDYHDAVQGAIKATTNAEQALHAAAQNAAIDPEAHLKSLGVDGKLMTAIGMVLSGIGSGVTGQSNLAMEAYQKNVDRAIQAQAQTFKNMMEISAQKQGLIRTAQDKQMIAANAYNAAVMSVATGSNVAIQGLMTQVNSVTALDRGAQLQNQNNLMNSQAIDSHSKHFSSTLQSGNAAKTTLMGETMKPIIDHLTGKPKSPAARGVSPSDRTGRPMAPANSQNDSPLTPAMQDNTFDRQLYEREQAQAEQEAAIRKGGSRNMSGGFLQKYGDK